MFKKNIAKLLVFAMVLSMLPFSAVSVGAATRADEKLGDYVSFGKDSVTAQQGNQTYTLSGDAETGLIYTLTGDAKVLPKQTVKVSFTATIAKDGETAKAAGLRIKQGDNELTFKEENEESTKVNETGSYTVNNDTYSVTCDVTITADQNGFCEVPFTFTAIPAEEGQEITFTETLMLKLKVYQGNQEGPDDPDNPDNPDMKDYSIELDSSVSVKVGESKTLTPTLKYGADDVTEGVDFTYQLIGDTNAVTLQGGTLTGANAGSAQIFVSAYVTSNDTNKSTGERVADATKTVDVTVNQVGGSNEYTITYTSNPDNGTVKVTAEGITGDVVSNSTEVEVGKTVTIIATPTDSTVYALNMDTFGAYKVDSDTAETWLSANAETGTYTFAMPASNVTITATFVNKPETPSERTVTVETKGDVVGTVVASGTYEVGSDVTLSVTRRPMGYNVTFELKDANGNPIKDADGNPIQVDEAVKNKSYSFKMPASSVIVVATFTEVPIPTEGSVTWESAQNIAKGNLTVTGTIEGKYYIFQMMKAGPKGGAVSAFVSVQATETGGKIVVPCAPAVTLTVTETDDATGTTGNRIVTTKPTSDAEGKNAFSGSYTPNGNKPDTPTYIDQTPGSPSTPDAKPRKITWESAQNIAKGNLVIDNALGDETYYILQMMKAGPKGGAVSAFVSVQSTEAGEKIIVPCAPAVTLTVTETKDATGTTGQRIVTTKPTSDAEGKNALSASYPQ